MNKCLNVIGILLVLLLFPYCGGREAQPSEGKDNNAHAALVEIDSLMWRRADSAFVLLQEFVVSPEAKELDTYDEHYCQVLISELLYKNYKQQSNRNDLLQAVDFFDSLTANTHGMSSQEHNTFLDARAHYINGAGLYERNDVVNACAEYLKALEVMEEQFEEKELTGKKAVFMFYAYNRLLELFSAQFMMDPAITCGEQVLYYCQKEASLSNQIPNTLLFIGKQYDKIGKKVEARQYYVRAIETMPDSNNLVFRDAVSLKALCDYQLGSGIDQPMKTLKQILCFSESEAERLTRFLTIGDVFFEEGMFDSALVYLEPAFNGYEDNLYRVKSAEYLRVIYDNLENKEKSDACVQFIADYRRSEGENKTLISKLEAMFKNYQDQKQEKQIAIEREKAMRKALGIIIPIIIVVLVVYFVLVLRNKKQLKKQQEEADRVLGETEQEHEKELRLWQTEAEKTLEETVKKHEEALKTKDSQHEQEMKAKQAEAMQQMEAAQRSHEEELKRQQAETERLLEEAERKHQQKMEDMMKRHEAELRLQKDQSDKEIEQTRQRHEVELEAERLAHQQEMETKEQAVRHEREQYEEELRHRDEESNQRLEEAELKHQQKVEEMMKRHEAELRIQKDQSVKEIEQTRQRHEAELESERLAYQKEREGLQLSLQLSKRNVNALQEELGRKRTDAEGHYEAFLKEPVCVKINDAVRDLQITTRKPYTSYRVNFDEETLTQFGQVVSAYYGEVKPALLCLYPSIAQEDLLLCYLYLLGMENKQIAVVRQREYSTVRKQAGELKRRLGIEESVRDYVLGVAGVEEFVEE